LSTAEANHQDQYKCGTNIHKYIVCRRQFLSTVRFAVLFDLATRDGNADKIGIRAHSFRVDFPGVFTENKCNFSHVSGPHNELGHLRLANLGLSLENLLVHEAKLQINEGEHDNDRRDMENALVLQQPEIIQCIRQML